MSHYDVVVIGAGPAGERAAIQAARARKRVAVVEKAAVVGGNRVNWGTVPSKTLRESAVFVHSLTRRRLHGIRTTISDEITVADFMWRERAVVQRELELVNESFDRYMIEVLHGTARFEDPHVVLLEAGAGRLRLTADFVVIATGSSPNRPADVPFDKRLVFDSDTILSLPRMPRSLIVLGAGVIGVEYASIFAALGLRVILVDTREELLPYVDREIVEIADREMRRLGVVLVRHDRYASIEAIEDGEPRVRCRTQSGNELEADALLYCVGRDGNTANLGLDKLGIVPDAYGLIHVNEHYQTVVPHIYAVGDVIGYPALASTSMEQGRQAIRHAFSIPGPRARTDQLPFAIYSVPEISYVGPTEEALRKSGQGYVVGRGSYNLNPRGQIIGDEGGVLKLLFDEATMRLLAVHIIGTQASELVHIGHAFLVGGITADQIAETLFNYPTLSDLYRHAALTALGEKRRREGV